MGRGAGSCGAIRRDRLLASTALGLLLPLWLAAGPARAEYVLDNVDPADGVETGGPGVWDAGAPIWFDTDSGQHVALPVGARAVLRTRDPAVPTATLTLAGTVAVGEIRTEANGFTLAGGTIAGAGAGLRFSQAAGTLLTVSSALAGDVTVSGGGTLAYAGNGAGMQSLRVDAGATLLSRGTTAGPLSNAGTVNLAGRHRGDVGNAGTLNAQGNATVTGALANDAGAQMRVAAGRTLSVAGGVVNRGAVAVAGDLLADLSIVEGGRAELTGGRVAGTVSTDETGTLRLDGATIDGDLVTRGRPSGGGGTVLAGSSRIGGDLTNSGRIEYAADADRTLTIGGRLTNSGHLGWTDPAGPGRLIVTAAEILLSPGSTRDAGVTLRGTEVIDNGRLFATDRTLAGGAIDGGLLIEGAGRLAVDAALDGSGYDITNRARLEVTGNGTVLNTARVVNEGPAAELTVAAGGRLAAGTLVNGGQLTSDGTLSGRVTNAAAGTLTSRGVIDGDLIQQGTAALSGQITGTLVNQGLDTTLAGDLSVGGLTNDTRLEVAEGQTLGVAGTATNAGALTVAGRLAGSLDNQGTLRAGATGSITGDVYNHGQATLAGRIGGTLTNHAGATAALGGDLAVGDLANAGSLTVDAGTTLTTADPATSSGTLTVAGRFAGSVLSSGVLDNAGIITGAVANVSGGRLTSTGTIGGALSNAAAAALAGTVGGTLTNAGDLTLTGDLAAGAVRNTGTVTVAAGQTLAAAGGVENAAGGRLDSAGRIAGDVANAGTAQLAGAVTGTLTNTADLQLAGDLSLGGLANRGTMTLATGQTVAVSGAAANEGALTLAGGTFAGSLLNRGRLVATGGSAVTGSLTNGAGGVMSGDGADARLSVSDVFTNNGRIEATAGSRLTITAGTLVFGSGSSVDAGRVTLQGDVANGGLLVYSDATRLEGGLTNTATGDVQVQAVVDAAGNDVTNRGRLVLGRDADSQGALTGVGTLTNAGTLEIGAGTRLDAGQAVNEAGGTITIAGTAETRLTNLAGATTTLAGGTLTGPVGNTGTLVGAGTIVGQVTNGGRIETRGTLALSGLTNTGSVLVRQGETLRADAAVANAGSLDLRGRLDAGLTNAAAGSVTLDGGRVTGRVDNAGTLTGSGTIAGPLSNGGSATLAGTLGAVVNAGTLATGGDLAATSLATTGTLQVAQGDRLSVQSTVDSSGTARIAGTLAADLVARACATTTLAGGTVAGSLQNRGTLSGTGTVTGALDNAGQATLAGALATVANAGTLATGGDLRVARLANAGTASVGAGHTLTTTATLANAGTLAVAGTLSGALDNAAGARTVLEGGRITGAVANDGTLTGTGTLDATLTNDGRAILAGSLGDVVNRGSLATAGALSVARIDNAGTLAVAAGHRLSAAEVVENRGRAEIGGTLAGAFRNAAGASTLLAGARIDGPVENQGALTGSGTVTGALTNAGTVTVAAGQRLDTAGGAVNRGTVEVAGTLAGAQVIAAAGTTRLTGGRIEGSVENLGTLAADGVVTGPIANRGRVEIAAGDRLTAEGGLVNFGALDLAGTLAGALVNTATGDLRLDGGTLAGPVRNEGRLDATATLTGTLDNRGSASLGGVAAGIVNGGDLSIRGSLTLDRLESTGSMTLRPGETLTAANGVVNAGRMTLAGTLNGDLTATAAARTTLAGVRITGDVVNGGLMAGSAEIGGSLGNTGALDLAGSVAGDVANGGVMGSTGKLSIGGTMVNGAPASPRGALVAALPGAGESPLRAAGTRFTVREGTEVAIGGGLANRADAAVWVEGRLQADVDNAGLYRQRGTLDGSLLTRGRAELGGQVTGDVILADGTLAVASGTRIGGTLDLGRDFSLGAGGQLSAGRVLVRDDVRLGLAGSLSGPLSNAGTLAAQGNAARVLGEVRNGGLIDLSDGDVGTRLTVGGLSGRGVVRYDINTSDVTADRLIVRGGRTTGDVHLSFANLGSSVGARLGQYVTLLDVDDREGAGNDFTYSFDGIPAASERIVYSIRQDGPGGDLQMIGQVNEAIGAMFANVTLVQSLIGSVINRPTSPYVTGLAAGHGDKPCGIGGWGRATGGHATVTGTTDNRVSRLENEVRSTYYGMQGGADLACFDGRHGGWNTALGMLGGVSFGDTYQPIYAISAVDPQGRTGAPSSVTTTRFQQAYAGVYATATRDRMQADLQLRVERTAFEIENRAVDGGAGLGLAQREFDSRGVTLSGSVSYSLPIARSGWNLTPTAGFAWSRLWTDSVRFSDGYLLEFDDSERQIGFVGGTLNTTFVQPDDNSALQTFVTGTFYKDFADPAVSILSRRSDPAFAPQVLTSDNLDAYGELSVGANYVKVLNPGRAGKPRQFSTSARIDTRFGDSIDSVGVTGQLRWQF